MYETVELASMAADESVLAPSDSPRATALARTAAVSNPALARAAAEGPLSIGTNAAITSAPKVIQTNDLFPTSAKIARDKRYSAIAPVNEQHAQRTAGCMATKLSLTHAEHGRVQTAVPKACENPRPDRIVDLVDTRPRLADVCWSRRWAHINFLDDSVGRSTRQGPRQARSVGSRSRARS